MNNRPNLFLIGASKCASTFLHHVLEQHSDICMSKEKEPCFFNRDDYSKDYEWYYSLFEHRSNEKIIGESSPIYSETTYFPDIPRRIYDFNPGAKIIYIAREPFSRLKSVYMQTMSSGHWYEKKFYNQIMSKNFNESVLEYPPFLEATRYWTHIQNYRKFFKDTQIKVILFEDLTQNYEKTIKEVLKFLEVEYNHVPNKDNSRQNKSKGKKVYNPLVAKLSRFTPSFVKKLVSRDIVDYIIQKSRKAIKPEPLTQKNIKSIEATLESEVKCLYNYLGIHDDPWKFFKNSK